MKSKVKYIILLVFFCLIMAANLGLIKEAKAETSGESLKSEIEKKNEELKKIKEEIQKTQEELKKKEDETKTYKGEIKTLENNIKQLNLGIKSAEVSLGKLDLEINSLGGEIVDIEKEIENKNYSMKKILKEMQFSDNTNTVSIFLKSRSLSEGVSNMQSLLDLNNQISVEVENLKNLRGDLSEKKDDRSNKKEEVSLQNKNLTYRKVIVEDQQNEKEKLLNFSEKQADEYSNKLEDLRVRQEEIANEISDIEKKLKENINPEDLPLVGSLLSLPIQGRTLNEILTQGYGYTDFARFSYKSQFHNGIDLGIPIGTPLFSSGEGEIVAVGNQDNYCYRGAYGRFIVVKHSNGKITSLYAHLSKYIVSPGQTVKKGELIGYTGNSGYSTGPHLHFTTYVTSSFYMGSSKYCGPMPFGASLNPLDYLKL